MPEVLEVDPENAIPDDVTFENWTSGWTEGSTDLRAGYRFDGWYNGTGSDATKVTAFPTGVITDSATYFAKWTALDASITFAANYEGAGRSTPTSRGNGKTDEALPNATYTALPGNDDVHRTGYELAGWYVKNGADSDCGVPEDHDGKRRKHADQVPGGRRHLLCQVEQAEREHRLERQLRRRSRKRHLQVGWQDQRYIAHERIRSHACSHTCWLCLRRLVRRTPKAPAAR